MSKNLSIKNSCLKLHVGLPACKKLCASCTKTISKLKKRLSK